MDHFGIGQALNAAAQIYFSSARGTGRTTHLLENLKNGDQVVFRDSQEARRVQTLCKERSLDVKCLVIPVEDPHKVFESPTPKGRTLFDHTWVEFYYQRALLLAQQEIEHFQRESSGFGEAHLETRRKAAKKMKWDI